MSVVSETRFLVKHELREYKCRLNESACSSKKKQNHDEIVVGVITSVIKHVKLMNIWILKTVLA